MDEEPGIDTAWAAERDVDEVLAIAASFACLAPSDLPRPGRVLEGAYALPDGGSAAVEILSFADAASAAQFARSYRTGSLSCGAVAVGGVGLSRDIAGQPWTEVVHQSGPEVRLAMVSGTLTSREVDDLTGPLSRT